ncbi:sigma factor [Paenibacillus sp. QZ-Y1]|uniref:sigma factor n=1 Tax=Paenibacillus sp. QZ-Y1 TaxID=3414511 RepID=UPI003F79D1FA
MMNHKKTKEQQFSEKISEIQNKLYRLAYCYVKNEQEALDIVPEATYKGYIVYGKMQSMTYFDSWMSRIVINTAIDHIRHGASYSVIGEIQTIRYRSCCMLPWRTVARRH